VGRIPTGDWPCLFVFFSRRFLEARNVFPVHWAGVSVPARV
jgi:hypothetical protein